LGDSSELGLTLNGQKKFLAIGQPIWELLLPTLNINAHQAGRGIQSVFAEGAHRDRAEFGCRVVVKEGRHTLTPKGGNMGLGPPPPCFGCELA
jgi:hypothetical protein